MCRGYGISASVLFLLSDTACRVPTVLLAYTHLSVFRFLCPPKLGGRAKRRGYVSFPFSVLIPLCGLEPAHARQSKCISSALAYSQISVFIIPPPLRDSPCLRGRKWVMTLNSLCPPKLGVTRSNGPEGVCPNSFPF